jgi:hypothetical protein
LSRIKHPNEKKRLRLMRDHRAFALEGNKSFRSAWRLKKAKASRRDRRRKSMALAEAQKSMTEIEDILVKPLRTLRKVGVMSLRQSILHKALGSPQDLRRFGRSKAVPHRW